MSFSNDVEKTKYYTNQIAEDRIELFKLTNTSLTQNTETSIPVDDIDNDFISSTSNIITVKKEGLYYVSIIAACSGGTGGYYGFILVNSKSYSLTNSQSFSGTAPIYPGISCSAVIRLRKDDQITGRIYGSVISDSFIGKTASPNHYTRIEMVKLL